MYLLTRRVWINLLWEKFCVEPCMNRELNV